jgi:hypothetical protein
MYDVPAHGGPPSSPALASDQRIKQALDLLSEETAQQSIPSWTFSSRAHVSHAYRTAGLIPSDDSAPSLRLHDMVTAAVMLPITTAADIAAAAY